MLDFMGMWEQAKQELEGMWASLDSTKSTAQASDAIKRAAGTPQDANMVDAIEKSRVSSEPVVLAPAPVVTQELDLFEDTAVDTTTDSLGTELDIEVFKSQLREDEGVKDTAYTDTEGHLTIGVGHKVLDTDNLKLGSVIDEGTLDRMLSSDASDAIKSSKSLVDDWEGLPSNVKYALSNMTFQLGKRGVSKFKKTLDLVNSGDYKAASIEMLDSKWAKQTPNRAKKMAGLMASNS